MRNILVRRGVYPWTISPEPRKDLGSPTDNSVRSADTIELKRLYGKRLRVYTLHNSKKQ